MCGIVGYLGPESPKEVILNGLKTLEYRGYDSSGVAILDHGEFKRLRAEGKLEALEKKLKDETFDGHIGIGHTRWATHGPPVEKNAHPHTVKGVNIVHNGIIENYAQLRERLIGQGSQMQSDTDSELISHLISEQIDKGEGLFTAVQKVVPQLEGAYAILAVSKDHPDELVAVKNGPPLILGIADKGVVAASDILAIVPYTKNIVYLGDDEVAHITNKGVELFDSNSKPIKLNVHKIEWSQDKVEKQGFAHYMLKEIYEQPRAVAAALDEHINLNTHTVQLNRVGFNTSPENLNALDFNHDLKNTSQVLNKIERIFIIACGTSYYAGQVAEYFIEDLARIPVEVDIASEFRYRAPVIPKTPWSSLFLKVVKQQTHWRPFAWLKKKERSH